MGAKRGWMPIFTVQRLLQRKFENRVAIWDGLFVSKSGKAWGVVLFLFRDDFVTFFFMPKKVFNHSGRRESRRFRWRFLTLLRKISDNFIEGAFISEFVGHYRCCLWSLKTEKMVFIEIHPIKVGWLQKVTFYDNRPFKYRQDRRNGVWFELGL